MDPFNTEQTLPVWQRVTATISRDDSVETVPTVLALRAAYRSLSQRTPMFRQLSARKAAQANCINGIRRLSGQKPQQAPSPLPRLAGLPLMQWCYRQELNLLRHCELRSADPVCGVVWTRLAEEQRGICRILLEQMGRMR